MPIIEIEMITDNALGPGLADDLADRIGKSGHPRENVHVLFVPDAAGRIAFGGEVRW